MNSFLDVAVETAREAGAILLAEFDRPVKISYKGEVDIVTQADKKSEQAIVSRLRTHFPKHAIGTSIPSMAPQISPMVTPVSRFPSVWRKRGSPSSV
jgi:3'-phosphoadenosine 5'-phosphosulfate (PAPS) 3'-phosphatase